MDVDEKEAEKIEQNTLHGRFLYDIFANNSRGFQVVKRFTEAVAKASGTFQFESFLVDQYFNELLLWRTKAHFRRAIVIFIYCMLVRLAEGALICPIIEHYSVMGLGVCCLFHLSNYAFTFRNLHHGTYVKLALCLTIFSFILDCVSRAIWIRHSSLLCTPYYCVIIIMFVLLPVRLEICVIVSCCLFLASILNDNTNNKQPLQLNELNFTDNQSGYPNDNELWKHFDPIQLYQQANLSKHAGSTFLLICRSLVWLLVNFCGFYLRFWAVLRRKYAFLRLGTEAQMRKKEREVSEEKRYWIQAVMPSQVITEYQKLVNQVSTNDQWVYNKSFNPVSILFADIVGFTNMSSNKTAHQVVTLLNDLFGRFDELCRLTQCEKIGTLGDCYYCVCGCPRANHAHAEACVEMGLGMCRIIKVFNCDHRESVGMRVGVHTGKVNAAIIGSVRFRFDVYSSDVMIANQMESTGRPGRVHVSETTYNQIKSLYNVSVGMDYSFVVEGNQRKVLKTYYIDPRSSRIRVRHEHFGEKLKALRTLRVDEYSDDLDLLSELEYPTRLDVTVAAGLTSGRYLFSNQSILANRGVKPSRLRIAIERHIGYTPQTTTTEKLDRDMDMIECLQTDPDKQLSLFQSPPIDPITMMFFDREVEWHYQMHLVHTLCPTYIDSMKVSAISDVFVLLLAYFIVLIICVFEHLQLEPNITRPYVLTYGAITILVLLCSFARLVQATVYASQIETPFLRFLFLSTSHRIWREISIAILSISPSLAYSVLGYFSGLHYYESVTRLFFPYDLAAVCLLIHCVPISSAWWARFGSGFISLCLTAFFYRLDRSKPGNLCTNDVEILLSLPIANMNYLRLIEVAFCLICILMVSRENEKDTRLCFFVAREADISSDICEKASEEAQNLLYNIIPPFVYLELKAHATVEGQMKDTDLTYATSIPMAGVVFASIANFFTTCSFEGQADIDRALSLLNQMVCAFDNLLQLPEMVGLEKIKTINECYMLASGLTYIDKSNAGGDLFRKTSTRSRFVNYRHDHLVRLMNFCHKMLAVMRDFNLERNTTFHLKIGYNCGPITAGIIGTTKPLYDIWGDTVNVASRMYSTGTPGQIQVPQHVVRALNTKFLFKSRGTQFVKGKGEMPTFTCIQMPELNSSNESLSSW